MPIPTIVTWYTDDFYARQAWRLARSCWVHRVPFLALAVASKGDWLRDVQQKPIILLDAMDRLKPPLLFVDADAVLMRPFTADELLLLGAPEDAPEHPLLMRPRPPGRRWYTGTIAVPLAHGCDPLALAFCVDWHHAIHASDTPQTEERALADLGPTCVGDLPVSLCAVIGEPGATCGASPGPAILHTQASRISNHGEHSDKQRAERNEWNQAIAERYGPIDPPEQEPPWPIHPSS